MKSPIQGDDLPKRWLQGWTSPFGVYCSTSRDHVQLDQEHQDDSARASEGLG